MRLLVLLAWWTAAADRSIPSVPPLELPAVAPGGPQAAPVPPGAQGPQSLPALMAVPSLPAAAAPGSGPAQPAAPAQAAQGPAAARQLDSAAAAAAPSDGKGPDAPALGAAYDGGEAGAAAGTPGFSALPVEGQLAASGWYQGAPTRRRWPVEGSGPPWLRSYAGLYKALAAQAPAGYRQETPRGPVFHLGGHDVVQSILEVPRSVPDAEVNLYGRFDGVTEHLDLWASVKADAEIMLNPESTPSLQRMLETAAKDGRSADALDQVQNNVFLKWNLVSLTPEGIETRALDEASRRDLERRRLRLSLKRGPMTAYEAQYNLIVAYRALNESPRRWTLDRSTRLFMADSLRALPDSEREQAYERASHAVGGMKRLRAFVKREFGL